MSEEAKEATGTKQCIRREKDGYILPFSKVLAKKPGFTVIPYAEGAKAVKGFRMEAKIDETAVAAKGAGALTREGLREEIENADEKEQVMKLAKKYGIENLDKRLGLDKMKDSVQKLIGKLPSELFQ